MGDAYVLPIFGVVRATQLRVSGAIYLPLQKVDRINVLNCQ